MIGLPARPSLRPSPVGRGRMAPYHKAKLRLPPAEQLFGFQKSDNGCSLFPRKRVRVRGIEAKELCNTKLSWMQS